MTEYITFADFKGYYPEWRWIIALVCVVVGLVVIAWSTAAI